MRARNRLSCSSLRYFQPVLEKDDAAVDDVLLDVGATLEEPPILLLAAEAHHAFDAGAVVPTAVEDHDLAGGREMLHVPLHVHLGLFPIRRRGQRDNAKHARADALGDGADGPALARAVAAFEHDDDSQPFGLHPSLESAQFFLKAAKLRVVRLALQLRVCAFLLVLVFFTHRALLAALRAKIYFFAACFC